MSSTELSIGIVGAGFIAGHHLTALRRLRNVRVAAICDSNEARASAFARANGVEDACTTLNELLSGRKLDAVHVLTPPSSHFEVARSVLEAGAHVFLEKPMCAGADQCHTLSELANARGLHLGVNHNFLFYPVYEALFSDLKSGRLGRPSHVTITWNFELGLLRSGPFDNWMLQDPRNIMLEIGPHAVGQMVHLVGAPDELAVRADDRMDLPGHRCFYRRWRIEADCGGTSVDLRFCFGPGFPERLIRVRGSLGTATADFGENTYVVSRHTRYGEDLGRYKRVTNMARELRLQGRRNLTNYILSKLKLSEKGNAFEYSIMRSIRKFYDRIESSVDDRQSADFGAAVVEQCSRIGKLGAGDGQRAQAVSRGPMSEGQAPDTLVLGGTGFIGRQLVRQLTARGHCVRVMSRSASGTPLDAEDGRVDVVGGSLLKDSDTAEAMRGVRYVFHLARGSGSTWSEYYEQEVRVAQRVGECCLEAGVERLIYTGTIASYYTGGRAGTITERTTLDRHLRRRDHYCRAKGIAEQLLLNMHNERQLPVVIFRPAIVIGSGGSPYHWGVGMWTDGGVCQLWGQGRNKLPFVLVEDVAAGLIAGIETPGIEGESFNLAGEPMLSAREYIAEIERHAGVKVQVFPTPIWRFYLVDMVKWLVKVAVRHPGRHRPSYRDWESRTGAAIFDCSKAVEQLGWRPAEDRDELIKRGIHLPLAQVRGGTDKSRDAQDEESVRLVSSGA